MVIYRGYSYYRPFDDVIPQSYVLIRRSSHALFNQYFCQYIINFYRWEGVPIVDVPKCLRRGGVRPNWDNVLKYGFFFEGIPKLVVGSMYIMGIEYFSVKKSPTPIAFN